MLASDLKSQISKLWDRFWAGGIANPLTAIEQISYLIFMKRLEDLDHQHRKRADMTDEDYVSVFDGVIDYNGIPINKEECRWSHWKHYTAENMLIHVRDKVFPFLKSIEKGDNGEFSKHIQDAVFMIPKASLLQEAVKIIDDLKITERNQDTQGDLYEFLLSELSQAGKSGQFRTPRHIIRMMIEIIDPKIGEKVCDPACGTAGFLINAYQYIVKSNTSDDLIKYDDEGVPYNLIGDRITDRKQWDILRRETFFGFDFDSTMVRIAAMNMILHGIEHPNIDRKDTLSKSFDHDSRFDVVLANPPFTGSIDKNDIHTDFRTVTTKTELLFLQLFHDLLYLGGRCAVIVPNGVLFGSSNAHKDVRRTLLEKCQMEAVISMPSGVFKPYSGVGTAVLVFVKGGMTSDVWFYDMKSDGFTLDDKRDIIDGQGDIPDIIAKYRTKEISDNSIMVPFSEIKANDYNLSISRYREVEHEDIEYDDPKEIIDSVVEIEDEILRELNELRNMVE
jgi:type I restriction enzyme M protein